MILPSYSCVLMHMYLYGRNVISNTIKPGI